MRSLWPSSPRSGPPNSRRRIAVGRALAGFSETQIGRFPRPRRIRGRFPSPQALRSRGRWAGPSAGAWRAFLPVLGAGPARRSNTGRGKRGPQCAVLLPRSPEAPVSIAYGSPAAGAARRGHRAGSSQGVRGRGPGRAPRLGAGRARPGSAGGPGGVGRAGCWAGGAGCSSQSLKAAG